VLAVLLGSTAFDSFSAMPQWRQFVDDASGNSTVLATLVRSAGLVVFATAVGTTFWLAARAMGIGLGWVSIVDPAEMCRDLGTPPGWSFTAYLCIGYPAATSDEPELQRLGWEERSAQSRAVIER
jgi:5,6-dimethylbenzimidazole synthase